MPSVNFLLLQDDELISKGLVEMTSNPSILTSRDIASASDSLQELETTALTNENARITLKFSLRDLYSFVHCLGRLGRIT